MAQRAGSDGKVVVVVTGASSGVGRATARAFAAEGARLGLVARGAEGLAAAEAEVEVEEAGGRALSFPADVAVAEEVEEAASEVERRFGHIDVWVNSAMLSVFSPVRELEAEEIRRVTEVTYLGTVNGSLAALRRMLPRDRGVIVQVGSALAFRAIPLQAAYCAAKHAVEGFTESLRTELMHDGSGVRVTLVHIPATNTPHFDVVRTRLPRRPRPVAPVYEPEVAARAIVWAAKHPRRALRVGGATTAAVLGNRVVPGLGDRYLARTGFDAQQRDEPVEPGRRDNLRGPLPGDRGTHGSFGAEASERSPQLWLATHRGLACGAAAAAATAAYGLRRRFL